MTKKRTLARTSAIAILAMLGVAQNAAAQGEIPLQEAISGQYHAAGARLAADAVAATVPAAAPVVPQYHDLVPGSNSERVTENAAAPAPREAPAPPSAPAAQSGGAAAPRARVAAPRRAASRRAARARRARAAASRAPARARRARAAASRAPARA